VQSITPKVLPLHCPDIAKGDVKRGQLGWFFFFYKKNLGAEALPP